MEYFMRRVREQLKIEADRYYRDRYGKVASVFIYYAIFEIISFTLHRLLPSLIEATCPQIAYMLTVTGTLVFVTLTWNLSIMWVYQAKLPFFEQYRVNPEKPWPWEIDFSQWRKTLKRSITLTSFAILVIAPVSVLAQTQLSFKIVLDMSLSPSFTQMLPQFILMVFVEDFFFFSTHILAHKYPFLYSFHKVHHEYSTSVAMAGLHFHVLQFMITQSLSTLINANMATLLGPFHITTLCYWIVFRLWDAYNAHSGYCFSWSPIQLLPFCTNDQYHDFHHSHNCGNYASHFRYLDWIAGTNDAYRVYKKQSDERVKVYRAKIKSS